MMSYERTLYIGLHGARVSVTSNCHTLINVVKRSFTAMLEPGHTVTEGWVEARRNGAAYKIRRSAGEEFAATPAVAAQKTIDGAIAELMAARADLVWLHAGAVADDSGALLVVGDWGRGKSTIVTGLCAVGWSFLSDDVIALEGTAVIPFPRTPLVRQDPGVDMPRERLVELARREIPPSALTICRDVTPVVGLVVPDYQWGSSALLERMSPGETALALLASCLNFDRDRARAVRDLGGLARSVPAFRLVFGNPAIAVPTLLAGLRPGS